MQELFLIFGKRPLWFLYQPLSIDQLRPIVVPVYQRPNLPASINYGPLWFLCTKDPTSQHRSTTAHCGSCVPKTQPPSIDQLRPIVVPGPKTQPLSIDQLRPIVVPAYQRPNLPASINYGRSRSHAFFANVFEGFVVNWIINDISHSLDNHQFGSLKGSSNYSLSS